MVSTMKWSWNPFSYFFSTPAEDDEEASSSALQIFEEFPTILDLPPEIRHAIWKDFSQTEFKALRQVCRTFCFEIDNLVGVNALLHGPRLWKDWTFTDEFNFICSFGTYETCRIQQNLRWIESVLVRSLNLKRLAEVPLNPSTLLQVPYMLHRLVVELEEPTPWNDLTDLLSHCTHLGQLDVSCSPHRPKLSWPLELIAYQEFADNFTQAILKSLPGIDALKQLSVRVVKDESMESVCNLRMFRSMPEDILRELATKLNCRMRLEVLKLSFPIFLTTRALLDWREYFEGQVNLRDLHLQFQFIYWQFFSQVVAKNARTLQILEACLSNFIHGRAFNRDPNNLDDDHDHAAPTNEQLNWTEFIGPLQNLRILKITMSDYYPRFMEAPHDSQNFSHLQLPNLSVLELHCVKLGQQEIFHIFNNFPSLRIVNLSYFTTFHGFVSYTHQASLVFSMIVVALTGYRMEMITLTDWCIRHYPSRLRQIIEEVYGNYTSIWPQGNQHTLASVFFDSKNLFQIKKRGLVLEESN